MVTLADPPQDKKQDKKQKASEKSKGEVLHGGNNKALEKRATEIALDNEDKRLVLEGQYRKGDITKAEYEAGAAKLRARADKSYEDAVKAWKRGKASIEKVCEKNKKGEINVNEITPEKKHGIIGMQAAPIFAQAVSTSVL